MNWCLIIEATKLGKEIRLGVKINKSNKYIDIAQRRMFSIISTPMVKRSVVFAERKAQGTNYVYSAGEQTLVKPKSYIKDIYNSSWWQDATAKETLL